MTKIEKTVLHLQIARLLRSISQGIAIVDLALYLKDLNWSAEAIGGVLSAAGIAGAFLILFVGVMSDRFGRKIFLVTYEAFTALAMLLLLFSSNPIMLAGIIVLTGLGRGQNGAAGPFTPAEQAWMAACVPQRFRGRVFSTNSALGFLGMAVGSVLAGATRFWNNRFPGTAEYHPLFFLMFLASLACLFVVVSAPSETDLPAQALSKPESIPAVQKEAAIRSQENKNILKLAGVNMINGLAVGFIGPMISYWFAVKFGVSGSKIGTTLALSFVFMAGSSMVVGLLTQRFGMVRTVVWIRFVGIFLTLVLPLMPTFGLASTAYVLRSAFTRGTQGARSALSSSLTRDERRGFSVSMNSLAVRTTSSVGPTLSGILLGMDFFAMPFFISGSLQLVANFLYGKFFKEFDRSEGLQEELS